MPLNIPIGFGTLPDDRLCDLTVTRHDSLVHGKDVYRHSVSFRADDWNDGLPVVVDFDHAYSAGVLSLTATAIAALLQRYPELKSGRFGVPRNRFKCLRCGTEIWSQFRHDFTRCRCGAIATDGGYDYISFTGHVSDAEFIREPWQPADGKQPKTISDGIKRKQAVIASVPVPAERGTMKAAMRAAAPAKPAKPNQACALTVGQAIKYLSKLPPRAKMQGLCGDAGLCLKYDATTKTVSVAECLS